MRSVSDRISHEKAWPAQVLTLSTRRKSFCIFHALEKKHHPAPAGWCPPYCFTASGLLRRGLARLLPEVMHVRHAAVHVVVHVPAYRALGKHPLGFQDFLEERVL